MLIVVHLVDYSSMAFYGYGVSGGILLNQIKLEWMIIIKDSECLWYMLTVYQLLLVVGMIM